MPKCYDCGKEQPVLKSKTRPTLKWGVALCDDCYAKSEPKTDGEKK